MNKQMIVAGAFALSACTGLGESAPVSGVSVYQYVGSKQCEGGGVPVEKMASQLSGAGIRVLSVTCGTDGRMYPAMCGAPDGRIGILEVPEGKVTAAAALGFARLSSLPGASKTVCPTAP